MCAAKRESQKPNRKGRPEGLPFSIVGSGLVCEVVPHVVSITSFHRSTFTLMQPALSENAIASVSRQWEGYWQR